MRIGFIGLGSQGAPMAQRIVAAGYRTTLWARRPATLEQFAETAAEIAPTPRALARASDLVCLCVGNDADIREVLTGEDGVLGGLAPGAIVAVHSTIHPDTCRELAETAAAQGVTLIDAAVSGGAPAVAQGRLLVMAGGPVEAVDRCRPVFGTYADPVVHLGDTGAGQVTKLLNNLLFTANLATAASTLALGRDLGVDQAKLGEVIANGSANSFALGRILAGTLARIGEHAGHTLRKDVGLLAELATGADAETGVALTAADETLSLIGHPR
ncbi:NAD(P)-dependent oxidoreductase [Nocardia alba]|uniref:3-hydroxyisobutyrate dehydrogenase-like beta-hydroxyacid dehydrogenase n=1 Tax=Nocardia alba TaxID=225051 RepID=A0A4R1FPM3_9NOCA|nr:NAD(P)-dependent oxidoreductase [Nocardia alba]TCJ96553.1 3-hydroxyisobutyrate dehydrogenase-like beta-hydroxyacid dehydrogenase [Nocardia alba]